MASGSPPSSELRSAFGPWLKQRRQALSLTQQEVADRVGLVRQQWIRIESGESGTRLETVPKIAEALQLPLAEVYKRAGFAPPSEAAKPEADFHYRAGVRLIDRRRQREYVLQNVEWMGKVAYFTLRNPVTGQVERLPFVVTSLEERFEVLESAQSAFQAEPEIVRLVAEAMRLRHAYLFNPVFATETSLIDPLPHQLIAIYGLKGSASGMLASSRLRFLLADDAGAGKTIMAGLYIREMLLRRLIRRVLIIPPAGLVGNWERELRNFFRLRFRIVESGDVREGVDNPFTDPRFDQAIVSLDLARQPRVREALAAAPPWDLVVCDEAHKLSARRNPDMSVVKTGRYATIEEVAARANHLLLLSATPHMGKDDPYFYLWKLLDPELFSSPPALYRAKRDVLDRHLLRRIKEEMVDFEGNALFKKRTSKTASYDLSPEEQALYEAVTGYVEDSYSKTTSGNRSSVGLALSVIQRRLASSTVAILRSLERRQERLEIKLRQFEAGIAAEEQLPTRDFREDTTGDEEVPTSDGREESEEFDQRVMAATPSRTIEELKVELVTLEQLVLLAKHVREQRRESKFEKLREVLHDYPKTKILIFTEHRDTLDFLVERMEALGYTGKIATIHGGMDYRERERQTARFRSEECTYLIATDAAGEGINLQFCWCLINYDIPWNPARLEQRMGRVHRYKQQHDVVLISLVAGATREGRVLKTLLDKLEIIRDRMGKDKVFDVIGEQLAGVSLSDLIFRATVQGETAAAEEAVAHALDPDAVVQRLKLQENRIALSPVKSLLEALQEGKATAEEKRMMPAYVRSFFTEALQRLGVQIEGEATGLFSLVGAPESVQRAMESYPPELQDRLTFDRSIALPATALGPQAIYLHPDEAVFEAVMTLFLGRHGDEAERGGLFYDPETQEPYLFALARTAVIGHGRDEDEAPEARQILGEAVSGVKVRADGSQELVPAHLLLTLDPVRARPRPTVPDALIALADDPNTVEPFVLETLGIPLLTRLREDLERRLPEREQQLRQSFNLLQAEKLEQRRRLKEEVAKGTPTAPTKLRHLDEELATLDDRRNAAIVALYEEIERLDLAPVTLYARAIVLPLPAEEAQRRRDQAVEDRAMQIAREFEEAQGALVEDVSDPSKANGYDLKATHPDGTIRYIEVKGRAGVGMVSLTPNEWSQAANHQDRYWLYTVFHCDSETPQLHRVADPFGKLVSRDGGVEISAGQIVAKAEKEPKNG